MIREATLAGLLGVSWGLNWPAMRLVLNEVPPWTFRTVGMTTATIIMFAVIRLAGQSPRVPRRHWLRLLAVGALTISAYNLLSAFAQLTASTSRSAVLSYTMPVWTVIFARIVLGERIDRRRQIGLGLGIAGLVALGWPIVEAGQVSIGLFYALMSGVVWAAGTVLLKRYPIDAAPLVITTWQIALGALAAAIGMLALEGVPTRMPTTTSAWLGLAYNVLIGQAFATTLWFVMLTTMSAGVAAIGSLLVPAIGVIGATLVLGERPTWSDWLGLALIVAASAVTLLRPSPEGGGPTQSATNRSSREGMLAATNRSVAG